MTSKRDRCLLAIAIQHPDSVDRLTVLKASAVVFRDYKAEFGKGIVVIHYVRFRDYKIPVHFNGRNFQVTLREETYRRLFSDGVNQQESKHTNG